VTRTGHWWRKKRSFAERAFLKGLWRTRIDEDMYQRHKDFEEDIDAVDYGYSDKRKPWSTCIFGCTSISSHLQIENFNWLLRFGGSCCLKFDYFPFPVISSSIEFHCSPSAFHLLRENRNFQH
jgi:hypothetical protein